MRRIPYKKVFILLPLLGLFQLGYSQENSKAHHLFFGLGVSNVRLQDRVFSPLVFGGNGAGLSLGYRFQSEKAIHLVNTGFNSQSLSAKLNRESLTTVDNINLFLDYQYLRKLPFQFLNQWLGVGLYNFASARNYVLLVEDEISADLFSSINIAYAIQKVISDHALRLNISLPVIAYVVGRMRVPNDFPEEVLQSIIEDPEDIPLGPILSSGNILGFPEFLDMRATISYQYNLSDRFQVGGQYGFRYYQYDKFLSVKNGLSSYQATVSYRLK